MDIELDGYDEFEELLKNMTLDVADKKRAIRAGAKIVANSLEENTPVGKTGNLAKIKIKVKDKVLYTEATIQSKAFYDIFQNFGTSQQKAHIGYFDRSVEESTENAVKAVAEVIFKKMK